MSPIPADSAYRLACSTFKRQPRCSNGLRTGCGVESAYKRKSGMAHRNVIISAVETASCLVWAVESCRYRPDWTSEGNIHACPRLKSFPGAKTRCRPIALGGTRKSLRIRQVRYQEMSCNLTSSCVFSVSWSTPLYLTHVQTAATWVLGRENALHRAAGASTATM